MIEVNGKVYPMWSQFVERKEEWVGGVLEDFGDPDLPGSSSTTPIVDIELVPNGKEFAFFRVLGEEFNCGFDVRYGGIGGGQEEPWLTFSGYGNHKWRIKKLDE